MGFDAPPMGKTESDTGVEERRWLVRLLQTLVAVWGCQIVLARVSSDTQIWIDILLSAFALGCMGILPMWLVHRVLRPGRLRRQATALVALVPVAFVVVGIAGPAAWNIGWWALAAVLGAVALGIAIHLWRTWSGGNAIPGPVLVFIALAAAAAVGWWLFGEGSPPLVMILTALGLGIVVVVLTSRPGWLPVAVGVVLAVGLWPASAPEVHWRVTGPVPKGPDIILLSVDTLRADMAAQMSSVHELAARGVWFRQAQAAGPWTIPSMASIMTGLPVGEHGAGRWTGLKAPAPIRSSCKTLAQRLAAHGYDTAAVVSPNGNLARAFGFDRGFAVYDYALDIGRFALPKGFNRWGIGRPTITRVGIALRFWLRRPFRDADSLVDDAESILRQRRDRPLFLWVHFLGTHIPYRHILDTNLPWSRKVELNAGTGRLHIIETPFWSTPAGRKMLWTAYRNEAGHIDRALKRLIAFLQTQDHRPTVIIFTADHGEEFFDHGGFEHGHTLYQELVHIPLVLVDHDDPRPPGTVEEDVVGHIDIAPTLLDAAGAADPTLPGQDLTGPIARVPYVSQNMLYGGPAENRWAVRLGRWKAIFKKDGPTRLYDLRKDPTERRNVAGSHPEVVALLAGTPRHHPREAHAPAAISKALKGALQSLGYLR